MPEKNITFEIKEHLGTIAKYDTGWNKELNVISWNGAPAKYDIRDWDEFHTRMSRGITLNPWDMRKLVDLYLSRNNDRAIARGKAIEAERNKRRGEAFKHNEEPPAEDETAVEGSLQINEDGEIIQDDAKTESSQEEPLAEERNNQPEVQEDNKEETPF